MPLGDNGLVPFVDVIIPVHSYDRPVERAVASIQREGLGGDVRVSVICHGINAIPMRQSLGESEHLRVLEHHDGVRSAAGPMNAGMDAATADYILRLDSDDYLEVGALSGWVAHARNRNPDVVLAQLHREGGSRMPTPVTRAFRSSRLNPVKDRLAYRTNPLGLLRLDMVRAVNARFTPGMMVGEDLEPGLRIWFGARHIDYFRGPGYVVSNVATDRITLVSKPPEEEMRATIRLARLPWAKGLSVPRRHAIGVKLLRAHVLGYLARPGIAESWSADEPSQIREAIRALVNFDPRVLSPFSIADRALIDAANESTATVQSLRDAIDAWTASTIFSHRFAPGVWSNLERESTLRRYVDQRLMRGKLNR